MLPGKRQDLFDVTRVNERSDGKHHEITKSRRDRYGQHVRMMRRNTAEPRLASIDAGSQLLHAAARRGDLLPVVHYADAVEDEAVDCLQSCISQAGLNLRNHRLVMVVDLVDDELAVATSFEGRADDLLAVTFLVARSGIDEVQTRIHGPMDGGDATIEWNIPISEVADAECRGLESRSAQFPARWECAAPVGWACARGLHYSFSVLDDGGVDYHKRGEVSQSQTRMTISTLA